MYVIYLIISVWSILFYKEKYKYEVKYQSSK